MKLVESTVTKEKFHSFLEVALSLSDSIDINCGLRLKKWHVENREVIYSREDVHTLSLYLDGGLKSFRTDKPDLKGGPGKFCLMPKGSNSKWAVRDKVNFVHLYISQQCLNWFVVTTFDLDARDGCLPEILYESDNSIRSKLLNCVHLLTNSMPANLMILEQEISCILHSLLQPKFNSSRKTPRYGGLSPFVRKQTREYLEANYGNKISLSEMAEIAQLSVFHFAKMFRQSFGYSPADYLTQLRVEKAKTLLQTDSKLVDISLDLGFSSQSHMTQAFKSRCGKTPYQYRALVKT